MNLQNYDENGSYALGLVTGATEAVTTMVELLPPINELDKIVNQVMSKIVGQNVDPLLMFAQWVDDHYLPEIFEHDEDNVLRNVSNTITGMVKIYKERGKYQCVK